jgi:phosphopantothenate synthetase
MKKSPFAYVLYMEHSDGETSIGVCGTLKDIEEALRNSAASRWAGLVDAEIVETLAEDGWRIRVFACTTHGRGQISAELTPFARTAKVA